jgi:hypothetical protein
VRRFEFTIDRDHAHAYNETLADSRRLRSYAAVATIVLCVTTCLLVLVNDPWAYILAVVFGIAALPMLWITLWPPRRIGAIEKLYTEGELIPSMISAVHPDGTATLLALVNLAKPDTPGNRYALITAEMRMLPGHPLVVGECVPAVSVPVDRVSRDGDGDGDGHWHSASAMPLAWATRDGQVIERARAAISTAEWELLADNLDLAVKVPKADARRLLLDPHDLPSELG